MPRRYLLPLLTALTCLGCAKSEPEPDDYSHAADFEVTGTLQKATPITFRSTSPAAKSWSWNFGDGTALNTEQQPTHTFRNAGTYLVKLLVQSTEGSILQSKKLTLALPDTLAADFTATGTLQNTKPITFRSTSSAAKSWSWNFGDGTLSTEQQPTHTFRSARTYPVRLTVMSASGPVAQTRQLTLAPADTLTPIFAIIAGEYRLTKVVSYVYDNYAGTKTTTVEACDVSATVSRNHDNMNITLGNPFSQTGGGALVQAPPAYKQYGFSSSLNTAFGYYTSFKVNTDSVSYNVYRNSMGGGSSTTYYGKKR